MKRTSPRMLKYIKKELDERSDLTETFEVSHIDDLPDAQKRPYIVVCIDEFVMLRIDETVMDILTEIEAIGRTLGVFAILSDQRYPIDGKYPFKIFQADTFTNFVKSLVRDNSTKEPNNQKVRVKIG